jgi:hypothetical protein
MKTKSQLKKENISLKEKILDLKIDTHKRNYIHIPYPTWKSIGIFFLTIFSGVLAIGNFLLLLSLGEQQKVWILLNSQTPEQQFHSTTQLVIIYPLIGEYVLIGLTIICIFALIKGGFVKLKPFHENALIGGLIWGLIVGFIWGLTWGLSVGLIVGLIGGLIGGLIVGLIWGLIGEFED